MQTIRTYRYSYSRNVKSCSISTLGIKDLLSYDISDDQMGTFLQLFAKIGKN